MLKRIVDVVRVVGDAVGGVDDLCFQQRPCVGSDRFCRPGGLPFEHFNGQVQAGKLAIALLELGDDPQAVLIVVEAAMIGQASVEAAFAGMAKRRMPQIVRQGQRFDQVFVQSQRTPIVRATEATSMVWVSRVR